MIDLKKVGFTGGSGLVGRHMKALLESESIDFVDLGRDQWDLADWKSLTEFDELLHGLDALIHLGAAVPSALRSKTTQDMFDSNVRCCVGLAEWALSRKVPIVYLSSATVYKDPHSRNISESDDKTTNNFGGFYGFTKYLAEQVFSHHRHAGLQAIVLRPTAVYGFGMSSDQLVATFLEKAERNEVITVQPPSANTVNFIHASDVANAVLLSLRHSAWGVYNIAGETNSIKQLATLCISVSGSGKLELICDDKDIAQNPFTRFDLNYEKATRDFSYTPKVHLEAGLKLMVEGKYLITHARPPRQS